MKALNAIYKHRHLYDTSTGKRIILDENSEISITVQENSLLKEDPYNLPHRNLRTKEELISLIEKEGKFYQLFLEKGKKLYFTVSAGEKVKVDKKSKIQSTDEAPEIFDNIKDMYLFEIELQEDLFWVSIDEDFKKPVVYDCACTVTKELYNRLKYFEPVYAPSLNQAYTRTFEFYFPLYGSANASIYNKISLNQNTLYLLRDYRNFDLFKKLMNKQNI